ncbi:carboxypeptidase-like regulatory domain-containing protein [Actinocorallia lasiicapitis]
MTALVIASGLMSAPSAVSAEPTADLTLTASPFLLPAPSDGPQWVNYSPLTLNGELRDAASGAPLPGRELFVSVVDDDGGMIYGTNATTDAQGSYQVTVAGRFYQHLTARASYQGKVATQEVSVGFRGLKVKFGSRGSIDVSWLTFLEQGPDITSFTLQRSFDRIHWEDVQTMKGVTDTRLAETRSSFWRMISVSDGITGPVASKVFDLRRWSTYFTQPKISLRKARYGKTLTVSGQLRHWADLTRREPARGRKVRLVLDCAGPGRIYQMTTKRTDRHGRFTFKTKAFCSGAYYIDYGSMNFYSPAYYSRDFASLSLPVKFKATAVPPKAKPRWKARAGTMPTTRYIRLYGRYPDRVEP